ncbi:hypothetical protein BDU57DRAFT_311305 [Ampelomyces quisqualis]|uniref:Secreted protein n=1 Tax=Ampelomyces quisqualis TaxID=50730 RepID=A0A6A5QHB2_AMPQU|nr:hypothetical protein BDU57DRAFT_311305 [Ampelomyces quisqualis]
MKPACAIFAAAWWPSVAQPTSRARLCDLRHTLSHPHCALKSIPFLDRGTLRAWCNNSDRSVPRLHRQIHCRHLQDQYGKVWHQDHTPGRYHQPRTD